MDLAQIFLRLYSFQFLVLLLCAAFYFRAAELEDASGLLWAGLSILVSLVTWVFLSWGLLACLGGQLGLLAAITLLKIFRPNSS